MYLRLPAYLNKMLLMLFMLSLTAYMQAQQDTISRGKAREKKAEEDTLKYYYLLRGTDIEGNLNYALLNAATEGDTLGIRWLVKNGADVDIQTTGKVTPLILAATYDQKDAVKSLLSLDASPDMQTYLSESALHIAVKNRNIEIAELLVRDSASINLPDRYGATPLHYASAFGDFYMADMLLYYDAQTFKKDIDGTTPLMAAVWAGYADVADLLIQNGANPEERDNAGFTPLLIAAQNGDTVIMEMLLKRMVDLYETNNYKYDALDIAIRSGHRAAVEYLLKKGSKWGDTGRGAVNPHSVAGLYKRGEIQAILRRQNIKEVTYGGIDQLNIALSGKACLFDVQTGISLSAREPLMNLGVFGGIDFKPFYTRVLVKKEDGLFYQYRDRSSIVYAGIDKEIMLTDRILRGSWHLAFSAAAGYTFGNKLRGTAISPDNSFRIMPGIGFRWKKEELSLQLSAEYTKTDYFKNGPLWFRMGLSYTFFLKDVRSPAKSIRWY
jgi:ankyrin repeat protein